MVCFLKVENVESMMMRTFKRCFVKPPHIHFLWAMLRSKFDGSDLPNPRFLRGLFTEDVQTLGIAADGVAQVAFSPKASGQRQAAQGQGAVPLTEDPLADLLGTSVADKLVVMGTCGDFQYDLGLEGLGFGLFFPELHGIEKQKR